MEDPNADWWAGLSQDLRIKGLAALRILRGG
jgi:hypothetical protein